VLDEIAEHCTTVNGSIVMAYNYTGSFYLPKVRNITSLFRWVFGKNDINKEPTPTSVNPPDLEYLGSSLWLNGLRTVRNVSMPKLKTVGWDMDIDYVHEEDFRSLETAEYVNIMRNISEVAICKR
jgi:hypothetical protein